MTPYWTPVGRTLIDGVLVQESRMIAKRNGAVVELLRADWLAENGVIGQVFIAWLSLEGISAWHAHAQTTDRITVANGAATLALYDSRTDSPTHGLVNEFHLNAGRPTTIVIPPRVWHGVMNAGDIPCQVVNMPDIAYRYDDPDHWRVAEDSGEIPYRFTRGRVKAL